MSFCLNRFLKAVWLRSVNEALADNYIDSADRFSSSPAAVPAPRCCTRRCRSAGDSRCITNIWCRSSSLWRCGAIWAWSTREKPSASFARDAWRARSATAQARALGRFFQQAVLADPRSRGAAARGASSSIWCATAAKLPAPIFTSWATSVTTTAPRRFCRRISTIRTLPAPPPEKKYWWPVPRKSDPMPRLSRLRPFQRIAWHWAEINRVILEALAACRPNARHVRAAGRSCGSAPSCARALSIS